MIYLFHGGYSKEVLEKRQFLNFTLKNEQECGNSVGEREFPAKRTSNTSEVFKYMLCLKCELELARGPNDSLTEETTFFFSFTIVINNNIVANT